MSWRDSVSAGNRPNHRATAASSSAREDPAHLEAVDCCGDRALRRFSHHHYMLLPCARPAGCCAGTMAGPGWAWRGKRGSGTRSVLRPGFSLGGSRPGWMVQGWDVWFARERAPESSLSCRRQLPGQGAACVPHSFRACVSCGPGGTVLDTGAGRGQACKEEDKTFRGVGKNGQRSALTMPVTIRSQVRRRLVRPRSPAMSAAGSTSRMTGTTYPGTRCRAGSATCGPAAAMIAVAACCRRSPRPAAGACPVAGRRPGSPP